MSAPPPPWFVELLAHRRWVYRTRPFPHVYVRDVFTLDFYRRLAEEFQRLRTSQPDLFTKVTDGYGAGGVSLTRIGNGPFEVFLSRAWNDLIAGVVGVGVTGDVEGSLHRHPPGSPRGWPHHDLTPAWFPEPIPEPTRAGLPSAEIDLKSGARPEGVPARELVRAVAVLFYLGNGPWQPGAGGETGLFADIGTLDPTTGQPIPAISIPPVDNSMIVFECTPRSWHTFLGANISARNCVVMWLHRPREQAEQLWGGERIVQW